MRTVWAVRVASNATHGLHAVSQTRRMRRKDSRFPLVLPAVSIGPSLARVVADQRAHIVDRDINLPNHWVLGAKYYVVADGSEKKECKGAAASPGRSGEKLHKMCTYVERGEKETCWTRGKGLPEPRRSASPSPLGTIGGRRSRVKRRRRSRQKWVGCVEPHREDRNSEYASVLVSVEPEQKADFTSTRVSS